MARNDLIIGAAVLAGAFLIFKYFSSRKTPTTQEQAVAAFQNAGATSYKATIPGSDAVYVSGGRNAAGENVTYQFAPGDFDKLNFAQKFLIGADRYIPGDWLTQQVLK